MTPADNEQRRIAARLFELLDAIARKYGHERFADVPANVLDVNEADSFISGELQHFILLPLDYAKNYITKRPNTAAAKDMNAALQSGREAKRKLERHLRRFLQAMLSAWQDDVLPTLVDAQAIAREEHREGEAIGPTIARLAQDGRLRVPSSYFVYELGRAIGLKDFTVTPAVSPWPATVLKDGHAELRPATTGDEWAAWPANTLAAALERMNARLELLGQRTRDIYYVMLAKWVQHTSRGAEGNPWIAVDEVLDVLGYERKQHGEGRRYGFLDRDRWAVRHAIESLGDVWVNLKLPAGKKVVPYRGHFVMLGDRRGQAELGTEVRGKSVAAFTHIEFALPALARQGVGPQAAPYLYLHIKALQYTAKQGAEKGLAYYLAEMARINVSDNVRARVETLLHHAGMTGIDPRKAAATRDRLHKALDTLTNDGLAEDWKYANAEWDWKLTQEQDAGKRPRWREEWPQQTIEVMLPQDFGYQTILSHRQERRARVQAKPKLLPPPAESFALGNPADVGLLARNLAARIQQKGISKAEAAAAIGVSRPTLDALLNGKPTRDRVRQQAHAWLHR